MRRKHQLTDAAQQAHSLLGKIVLDLENAKDAINNDEHLNNILGNGIDELYSHLDVMQTRIKSAMICLDESSESWERADED